MKILLIKLRAIGDAVLTLPSLEGLYRGFDRPRITVVCPPAAVGIYRDDPRCAEVLVYDKAKLQSFGDHAALWQELQGRHFDLAVCLHASFRTALLGWASGAPLRSVRNHSGPDWFGNLKAAERKEAKSIIQRDFDALRACGLDPKDEQPKLALPPSALAAAAKRIKAWKLKGKAVLLFPGAGKPEKRWPLERFLALAKLLKAKGRQPVFLSGPGEAKAPGALWDSIADLKELGAVCRRIGFAIGNDSGPRHIAAASGAKTLTLFGPEGLQEWHPYPRARHWALQAGSGRVEDLSVEKVSSEAVAWLRR